MNEVVLRLGIVSFLNDISTEMLYPLTPIFLTAVLGASMTSVGLIEGFADFIASFLKTYFGRWSDEAEKRRPFVIGGYSLSTLARPLIGLARAWPLVFVARALDRTGKAARTAPRDALLAESVDAASRGRAFGWHRGLDSLGAVLGPLVALWLLSWDAQKLRPVFYWSVVPGALAVLLLLFLREKPRKIAEKRQAAAPAKRWVEMPKSFRQYLFAWGVFSLVNSSDAFLLLKIKSTGQSLAQVILLYCFYNVFYAVTSPFLGHVSDRFGRKHILIFGFVLFAGVYAGFSFAHSIAQFAGLLAVYGVYMGATDGVGKAWAIDLVPNENKGMALGMLGTTTGLCAMAASFAAGLLWDHIGSAGPFFFGAAGALISIVLLLFVRSPDRILASG